MAGPFDPTASAHLDSGDPTKPVFLLFLDFMAEPIRATTLNHVVYVPTTPDEPDISEQNFYPTIGVLNVGEVRYGENGSETVALTLSGPNLLTPQLIEEMADRTNWQGRRVGLWVIIRDENRRQRGAIADYYSGYAVALSVKPREQKIEMQVEGYKALLNQASHRSYLDQSRYDPDDESATATIGATNGATTGPNNLGPGADFDKGYQVDSPIGAG